ncbi:hypothetical protein THH46_12875 [Pseudomonas sp. NA13]
MTLYAGGASADTADTAMFSLSSFGTVGIVHSSEKKPTSPPVSSNPTAQVIHATGAPTSTA